MMSVCCINCHYIISLVAWWWKWVKESQHWWPIEYHSKSLIFIRVSSRFSSFCEQYLFTCRIWCLFYKYRNCECCRKRVNWKNLSISAENCTIVSWSSSRNSSISWISASIICVWNQTIIQIRVCCWSSVEISRDWISLHNNYCWTLWNSVFWFHFFQKVCQICLCSCFVFKQNISRISISEWYLSASCRSSRYVSSSFENSIKIYISSCIIFTNNTYVMSICCSNIASSLLSCLWISIFQEFDSQSISRRWIEIYISSIISRRCDWSLFSHIESAWCIFCFEESSIRSACWCCCIVHKKFFCCQYSRVLIWFCSSSRYLNIVSAIIKNVCLKWEVEFCIDSRLSSEICCDIFTLHINYCVILCNCERWKIVCCSVWKSTHIISTNWILILSSFFYC